MAKKQKYYVVWTGHHPGVYNDWDKCQAQLKGFENAKYKSFLTLEQADSAFNDIPENYIGKNTKPSVSNNSNIGIPIWDSLSVDASCLGNPGIMEYRCVCTKTKQVIFNRGPYEQATQNIGEFLALTLALIYVKQKKLNLPIYSDSMTAIAWVRNKQAKTQLQRTSKNEILFQNLEKAVNWLQLNTITTPILKWKTEDWGEIPADYGRK